MEIIYKPKEFELISLNGKIQTSKTFSTRTPFKSGENY